MSATTPELDGTRIQTITVSGNDGRYWRFGIEGHGVKWHRIISQKQFKEVRIEYEMSVAINFGQGFGTIAVPPLDPHAIVADLKFADPSEDYTVGNISIVKHVYNINNVTWSPQVEPPPVPESSGINWVAWLLLLLIVIIAAAYIVAKRYPDSTPGRLVRSTAETVGIARALGGAKNLSRRTVRGVHLKVRKGKVVKAEVVAEEPSATVT